MNPSPESAGTHEHLEVEISSTDVPARGSRGRKQRGARSLVSAALLLSFLTGTGASAQSLSLEKQIQQIAAQAHGEVSVACALPGTSLSCNLNPKARAPMQSVFKLPLAITILHQVEEKRFSLDQPIRFQPSDRFVPHAFSPLQDEFPNANVDVSLQKLLRLTVSKSDNAAADILLRLAGGPAAVQEYIDSLEVSGFRLVDGEHALHRNKELQYRNYFEPAGAVRLLRRLSDDSPLTLQDTELLLGWMRLSNLTDRLQGDLPTGVVVAHKSGSSDVINGLAAATNDIGLIPLPDGRQLAIAIFITNSTADDATRAKVIARIARAIFDDAIHTTHGTTSQPAAAPNERPPSSISK